MSVITKGFPPLEFLNQCIQYDPESGKMTWKDRPDSHFYSPKKAADWRQRNAGKEVGSKSFNPDGRRQYIQFHLTTRSGEKYFMRVHMVVFALEGQPIMTGLMVDHINGDIWDNRRSNLRLVTALQNTMNSAPHKRRIDNLPKNVFTRKNKPGFYARISINKKRIGLGVYSTPELAYEAVKKAALEHHGEYARV